MEYINIKKLLILFYIIIPFIFYSIPLMFFLVGNEVSIHFYRTYYPDVKETLEIIVGHIILGISVYVLTKKNIIYKQKKFNENIFYNILTILIFVLFIFGKNVSGIISMLSMGIFVILVSNVKIYKITYIILLALSFVELIVYKERYLTVFVVLLMGLSFLSKRTLLQLILFSFIGIFVLVFILQPLRYGNIPFSNLSDIKLVLFDVYKHLNSIYYTAYLANSIDFNFTSLLVEFIPFGKSLSGELGIVERLAQVGLPQYLVAEGARLGSNSAMYFSLKGIVLLILMLGIIYGSQKVIKSTLLTNSIIMYLIIQGPYFIRRSFASFTIDIIIIICLVLIVLIIKQSMIGKRNES